MPPDPLPLPADREAAAVEVLRRLYTADTPPGWPLHDEGMEVEWVEREIAAFIRKFGPLPEAAEVEAPTVCPRCPDDHGATRHDGERWWTCKGCGQPIIPVSLPRKP